MYVTEHNNIHRLSPPIGAVKSLSASSCNEIKQQFCDGANGLYWVKGMEVCMHII